MTSALLPRAERRVGRLRVRAREESEARHASTLLADALRTASLPLADEGQLLVVRKLSLGRISPFASSATLALQVELAMGEARLAAVHFDSPAAGSANAVIFPSRAEALGALARLHARRIEPREWFWRAAVAGWAAPLSRPERWRTLLDAAHELPEAAVISARIVREALRAGIEDELLSAIPPGRGAEWLEREGWSWSDAQGAMNEVETGACERNLPAASADHREVIDRAEQSWGPVSERLVWLATVLAVAENPARAGDPGLLVATTARLLSRVKSVAPRRNFSQSSSGAGEKDGPDSIAIAGSTTPVRQNGDSTSSPGDAGESSSHAAAEGKSPGEIRLSENELTSFAGLLFLVPILARLGFPEFLAGHPELLESRFPLRFLRFVGARVGMLADDPIALALDYPAEPEPLFSEADLPNAAREMLAVPAPRAPFPSSLMAWTTALRRWSRRHARLGLISLIRRRGRVAISPTHLDIFFDLATADLRLRRVALDVDPGWVPWLGRVVRFHYLKS